MCVMYQEWAGGELLVSKNAWGEEGGGFTMTDYQVSDENTRQNKTGCVCENKNIKFPFVISTKYQPVHSSDTQFYNKIKKNMYNVCVWFD